MFDLWQVVLKAWNFLAEPFSFEFILRAFASALIVGTLCAVTGSFLIVRRLSLLGLVVSNSVIPGVAIAFLLSLNIFVGGFLSGVLATLALSWLQLKTRIKEDAAMGIVMAVFFSLGIILITEIQKTKKVDLNEFLYGNILGITYPDLFTSLGIGVVALVIVYVLFRQLVLLSFDPLWTEAVGLPANRLHYTLMALISLTVVASMQAVGVVLTIALMIIPGATAYLITKRFATMIKVAMGLGVVSSIVGLYISFYLDIPSGPSIVMVSAVLLLATIFLGPLVRRLPWQALYDRIYGVVVLKDETVPNTAALERADKE
ncbi:metal ABC transporter permease [Candidatus Cyanaurora vandensis]|uniref:metal ABC transporter permease n=1 Tax=Candidatus Cyanaurora vandensis TaxID=2714958 RepID=UPI0025798FB0|nr:metal ABC transporter permease [Candidatus Cyanaurora vandensis]